MEPQREHYDIVVIGAGIGGLSCAGLLAKAGFDVLLVEQRPEPGGLCFSYERECFTIDVGPHLLSGCGPDGELHNVLTALGVADAVDFIRVDPLAKVVFPEYDIELPADHDAFVERLSRNFPEEQRRLSMLFREMEQMYREVDDLPSSFGIMNIIALDFTA